MFVVSCLALVTAFVACRSLLFVRLRLTTAYTDLMYIILSVTNIINVNQTEGKLHHM